MILRADRGTKNTDIAFLQPFYEISMMILLRTCMANLLLTKFVYLNLYLFVSINHVQTSVLRLGGGNFKRTLHNGGWIILRCENYSVSCRILATVTVYTGFERIR